MQIKLVQLEIEEAIRNYIQEQVTVKDGMQINIALSATRGDEGFIANIEIVRSEGGTALSVAKVQAPPPPVLETPTPAPASARVTRAPRQALAQPAAEAPAAKPEEAPAEESPATASVELAESDSEQEAPPAAPAGKSLFGGLSRPTNA